MNSAIIVAAGKGTRMGSKVDKLFLELNGRPVVAHTWQRLEDTAAVHEVILVIRDGLQSAFEDLARKYNFRKPFQLVTGGKERQDSVWNGLAAVSPTTEIVAIQDGARPCTSPALIQTTIEVAGRVGGAVAARAVTDTIKESADGKLIERTLDRTRLWAVQTPQTFQLEVIRRALSEVRHRGIYVTDDTAACELIGQPVELVLTTEPNPKVTSPQDFPYIEQLLSNLRR